MPLSDGVLRRGYSGNHDVLSRRADRGRRSSRSPDRTQWGFDPSAWENFDPRGFQSFVPFFPGWGPSGGYLHKPPVDRHGRERSKASATISRREDSCSSERSPPPRDRSSRSGQGSSPARECRSLETSRDHNMADTISLHGDRSDPLMREYSQSRTILDKGPSGKGPSEKSKLESLIDDAEDPSEEGPIPFSLTKTYQDIFDILPEDLCKPPPPETVKEEDATTQELFRRLNSS